MLSNAYFLAKFRFDTAENEPAKKLQNFAKPLILLVLISFANTGWSRWTGCSTTSRSRPRIGIASWSATTRCVFCLAPQFEGPGCFSSLRLDQKTVYLFREVVSCSEVSRFDPRPIIFAAPGASGIWFSSTAALSMARDRTFWLARMFFFWSVQTLQRRK